MFLKSGCIKLKKIIILMVNYVGILSQADASTLLSKCNT